MTPNDGEPIPYLQRISSYYQALGYGAPYEWARCDQVPFQPLARPLSQCRVALITTAAPYQPGQGDQGPGAPYNARAKFYSVYSGDSATDHDLRISHVAIDRQHTTAVDPGTYFPLPALRASAGNGRIGSVLALGLLESAPAARTTLQSPLRWSDSEDWKRDYSSVERLTAQEIDRRRAEFDRGKQEAKALRGAQRPGPPC